MFSPGTRSTFQTARELQNLKSCDLPIIDSSKIKLVDPVVSTVDTMMQEILLKSCALDNLLAPASSSEFKGLKGIESWMGYVSAHPLCFEVKWFEDASKMV